MKLVERNQNKVSQPITSTDLELLPERIEGKIYHINEEKGWGFIQSNSLKFTRIFFHWQSLEQDTLHFTELKKGMKVEFTPDEHIPKKEGEKSKGWRAIRINVIDTNIEDEDEEENG